MTLENAVNLFIRIKATYMGASPSPTILQLKGLPLQPMESLHSPSHLSFHSDEFPQHRPRGSQAQRNTQWPHGGVTACSKPKAAPALAWPIGTAGHPQGPRC